MSNLTSTPNRNDKVLPAQKELYLSRIIDDDISNEQIDLRLEVTRTPRLLKSTSSVSATITTGNIDVDDNTDDNRSSPKGRRPRRNLFEVFSPIAEDTEEDVGQQIEQIPEDRVKQLEELLLTKNEQNDKLQKCSTDVRYNAYRLNWIMIHTHTHIYIVIYIRTLFGMLTLFDNIL